MAQGAEKFRATLTASAKALRRLAASRLSEVRERVSPDILRREATAFVRRLRQGGRLVAGPNHQEPAPNAEAPQPSNATAANQMAGAARRNLVDSAKTLRLRAASSLADLRARPFPGGSAPAMRRIATMRARLLLTGANIETLSQGDAQGEREESKEPLRPVPDVAAIVADLAPEVIQMSLLETASSASEPVRSNPSPPARAEQTQAGPAAQVSALSRLRNDVLVRTALERPVLAGVAAIALGTIWAALSSTERAPQPRIPAGRSPTRASPDVAEAEGDKAAPVAEGRGRSRKASADEPADGGGTAPSGKARAPKRAKPKLANGGSSRASRASGRSAEAAPE